MKIIIYVEGGNIQEILSSDKDIEIEIIDYDNEPATYKEKEEIFHKNIEECPFSVY
jgi:hypothetical protein